MDLGQFDRRQFLAVGGGAFLCTLAGHRIALDKPADVEKLAAGLKVPPKVARAQAAAEGSGVLASSDSAKRAFDREYWIRAEKVKWNIVPTAFDEMMDEPVSGKTVYKAWAYRQYTADFASPIGRAQHPRAADRGRTSARPWPCISRTR